MFKSFHGIIRLILCAVCFTCVYSAKAEESYMVGYACSLDATSATTIDNDVTGNYTIKDYDVACPLAEDNDDFLGWVCVKLDQPSKINYYNSGDTVSISSHMTCLAVINHIDFVLYDYNNDQCDDDYDITCIENGMRAELDFIINSAFGYTSVSDVCIFREIKNAITIIPLIGTYCINTLPATENQYPYTAKKTGYRLEGWYKQGVVSEANRVGGTSGNIDLTIDMISIVVGAGNQRVPVVILKGNWEPIDFNIVYHGIESGDVNPNPATYNIENVDDNVIKLQNPSRSGYEFLGWCVGDSACSNPKKGDEAPTVSGEDIDENDLTQEHNTKHFYARWHQFECPTNKYLHVGIGENDKICMFTGEPENKPVIRIQKDTDEFYIKLIKDINQVMHPGSTKKFHVQLSNGIYNAYDFIEEDATPACGLLPFNKGSYDGYDFNDTIEQDGDLYVQTHFDVTTGRCECPSTLTTTNNINCAVERIGVRIGFSNRLFCKVTACLEV